jgi:hypothetical protein
MIICRRNASTRYTLCDRAIALENHSLLSRSKMRISRGLPHRAFSLVFRERVHKTGQKQVSLVDNLNFLTSHRVCDIFDLRALPKPSPIPPFLHEQIFSFCLRALPGGDVPSTFKEVAQLAGVSHSTVSHIINNHPTHCNTSPHNSTRQLCLQC